MAHAVLNHVYDTENIQKAAFAGNLHPTNLEGIHIHILFIKRLSIQVIER